MPKFDENADLFPEGWHKFQVEKCEDKWTKNGGHMWTVNLMDLDTGRTHIERWWAEGEYVGMTTPKLKAMGMDFSVEIEAPDLVGRQFFGKVKHKEGKGDFGPQAQIGSVKPISSPPAEYREPDDKEPMPFDGPKPSEDTPF